MEIKGILFDMDGTLINTYENFDYKQAFRDMSTIQKELVKQILQANVHSFAVMEEIIQNELPDKEANDLIQKIHDFLVNHYKKSSLKKDALRFLKYVKEKGYKLCLCTNNATDIIHQILEDKQMTSFFDFVVTSQQVQKSKPDPQMYQVAMEKVGLKPSDCIIFEDSESGVLAAEHASVPVVLVSNNDALIKDHVNMMIKDYADERLYKEF
ncbi:HAD family hydrolase [Erysipelotrichaceae bacterium HCN-30851]